MGYSIKFTEEFEKEVKQADKSIKKQISKSIEKLRVSPEKGKPLVKMPNYFRIRIKNFRLIYRIDKESKIIYLVRFMKRKFVYK